MCAARPAHGSVPMSTTALPTQSSDFPAWYGEVVRRAGLAENSSVRGAMVIKPYGYAIWEAIQRALDDRIKATGHENVYFPLLVPASVLAQEGELVEGFAPEVAVVTRGGRQEAGGAAGRASHLRGDRSGRRTPAGCSRTATCRCSTTSGPTSSAGSCGRASSCARASSSGRRATPRTRRRRRRWRRRCRSCTRSTPTRREGPGDPGAARAQERERAVPRRRRAPTRSRR